MRNLSHPILFSLLTICLLSNSLPSFAACGDSGATGTVVGGLAGGILGHQVGGGNGKVAATILGTIAGAVVGNKANESMNETDCQREARANAPTPAAPETRTVVVEREVVVEHHDHYRHDRRDYRPDLVSNREANDFKSDLRSERFNRRVDVLLSQLRAWDRRRLLLDSDQMRDILEIFSFDDDRFKVLRPMADQADVRRDMIRVIARAFTHPSNQERAEDILRRYVR